MTCEDCLFANSIDDSCDTVTFCLDGGNFPAITDYNGTYEIVGSYNGHNVYSATTVGVNGFIFYDDTKWCLSSTIGGECALYGSEPCNSLCPDICSNVLSEGICTTTTTICDVDLMVQMLRSFQIM